MTRFATFLLAGTSVFSLAPALAQDAVPQAGDSYFAAAAADLDRRLAIQPITTPAKNVILFVADGMSIPTITAGRIYEGQKRGVDGESNNLAIDTFPYSALVKTYTHDAQVADSAPTAVAMTTGVKTRNDIIGVDQTVPVGDCAAAQGHEVKTIFEMAEEAGLATGVVSTARITHATPAATYAHVPNRDWEDDKAMADRGGTPGGDCKDIADQLVNWPYGDGFEIALGGGRSYFLPDSAADPEDTDKKGQRTDGRNLVEEWTGKSNNHVFVFNNDGFGQVDWGSGARVLGLFEGSHMEYEADRAKDAGGEPSLAEMTEAAIKRLQQDEDGFVLMVEGGRVDHAHHDGNAARALEDMVAFDEAIKKALELTEPRGHADRRDRRPQPHADHQRLSEARQPDPRPRRRRRRRDIAGRRRQALYDAELRQRARRRLPGAAEGCAGGDEAESPGPASGSDGRRHDECRFPAADAAADGLRDAWRRRRGGLRLGSLRACLQRRGRAEPDLPRHGQGGRAAAAGRRNGRRFGRRPLRRDAAADASPAEEEPAQQTGADKAPQ